MKKIYTLIAAAAVAMVLHAGEISTRWANLFEACPPTQGCDMTINGDNLFYLLTSNTTQGAGDSGWPKEYTDPSLSVYYGGKKICTGAPYEGASYNSGNLTVLGTDREGQMRWVVYSTSGEFSGNDGGIALAPDGGVYVATQVRHTQNMLTSDILITDATGATTSLGWRLPSTDAKRYFRGLLLKISAAGKLEWTRFIDASTAPQPAAAPSYAEGTFQAISMSSLKSDSDGNIYLAARYCNPLTLYRADGTSVTFKPHNTTGWNGDTQDSRGDLIVAKFDSQGYYTNAFTTTGSCKAESMTKLALNGSNLVFTSFVSGTAEGDYVQVGDKKYSTPGENQGILVASLNKDIMQPQWSTYYPGAPTNLKKQSVLQWNDLQVAGNSIIVNGMGNFTLVDNSGNTLLATQNQSREGFVIKLSAADGSWKVATTSMIAFPTINVNGYDAPNSAINGWLGCFEADDDNLYVYGYNQGQQSVYLAALSSETLQPGAMWHLIKGGSMPTALTCLAQGNVLYTMSRGRVYEEYDDDGNVNGFYQNFNYIGAGYLTSPLMNKNAENYFSSFAVPLAAFNLPFSAKTDELPGDVNGDNSVNAADVTALYNYILNGDNTFLGTSDVNGDGAVNAGDVTAVYNIILGL